MSTDIAQTYLELENHLLYLLRTKFEEKSMKKLHSLPWHMYPSRAISQARRPRPAPGTSTLTFDTSLCRYKREKRHTSTVCPVIVALVTGLHAYAVRDGFLPLVPGEEPLDLLDDGPIAGIPLRPAVLTPVSYKLFDCRLQLIHVKGGRGPNLL